MPPCFDERPARTIVRTVRKCRAGVHALSTSKETDVARFVAPLDAVWLWIESETSPTSVVVLQIFRPPARSGPQFLDDLYAQITDPTHVKPGFRRRAYRSAATGGQFAWADDGLLDMTAHVRRATLPAPGRIRELLEFVGELHGQVMGRQRPQWEARLVDG